MNKKIIVFIILCIVLIVLVIGLITQNKKEEKEPKGGLKPIPVLELEDYKDLKIENIKGAKVLRYTEGGIDVNEAETEEEIKSLYNTVSKLEITEETDQSCEDNTTVFTFTLEENRKISIKIECDWLVYRNKKFMLSQKAS